MTLIFVSVHLYSKKGKVDDALKTGEGFAAGKPVVIEETFYSSLRPQRPPGCPAQLLEGRLQGRNEGVT
jgi:hypothetical protein